jgi:hypothetical protein
MRSIVLAIVEAVWSINGCWGDLRDSCDGMGEWTYSAHWRSRER